MGMTAAAVGFKYLGTGLICLASRRCPNSVNHLSAKISQGYHQTKADGVEQDNNFGLYPSLSSYHESNEAEHEKGGSQDELHLDGVVLLSNSDGMYLGDPELEEFFAELNRRKAVVFIHPDDPPFADMRKPDVPVVHIEWPFDTTRAVANMVYSGTLDRNPRIRFILPHGGGAVPYLAWRISILEYRQRDKVKKLRSLYDLILRKQGPATGLRLLKNMYYDTTAVTVPSSLRTLKELVDPSHIVLGTDLGAAPKLMAELVLRDLKSFDGFDQEDLRAIARKGALELFPSLASA